MGRTSHARERLLSVAFEVMWDSSYGSVSVDQICERAKVNKGSFYYFFGSKSDLAVAAQEEHWKQEQPDMDRLFSAQVPPLERLAGWCDHIYIGQKCRMQKCGRVCGCPYGSIGAELATQDDKIRLKAEEMIARGARYVESAIADAKREDLVGVEDPKLAAEQIYAFVAGSILRAKIRNDVEVLKNLVPTVLAIAGAKRGVSA
jgi:TetR/AcrR family transcriptional repressor of nem operon